MSFLDYLIIDRHITCNLRTGLLIFNDETFILIIPHRGKHHIPPRVKRNVCLRYELVGVCLNPTAEVVFYIKKKS